MSNNLEKIKNELIGLATGIVLIIIILKICFYRESILVIIRVAFSLFWLLILPGFCLMWYWQEKFDFLERIVMSLALSAAITGILSYYLGLIGINLKYHPLIIPPLAILMGVLIFIKKENKKERIDS